MLSHVMNSQAGQNGWESHVDSLFKVTFIPPSGVSGTEILTEQVITVTGWKFPSPDVVTQGFMQSKRAYASVEVENLQELEITFELNLNDTLQNYVYNTIQEWKKLIFNPETGERGLKKDYLGTIIVESFASNGDIYWKRTVHNIFPKGNLDSIGQNDYNNAEPVKLATQWVGEYFKETKY